MSALLQPENTHFFQCFSENGFIMTEILRVELKMTEKYFKTMLNAVSKYIESYTLNGIWFVRAKKWEYAPYDGINHIFCMSHTTHSFLGVLHAHHPVNILTLPENCENKGAKAFVDIYNCNNLQFWMKKSDVRQNKIYCFDFRLRENFMHVEYVSDYNSLERIEKFKTKQIHNLIDMFSISKEDAMKRIQRLFITSDDC
jgi:hypothetical protein